MLGAVSPFDEVDAEVRHDEAECRCPDCLGSDPVPATLASTTITTPPPPAADGSATRKGLAQHRRGSGTYLQAAVRALQAEQTRDTPPRSPAPSGSPGGSSSDADDSPATSRSSNSSPWRAGSHWTCRGHQSCGYRHNHPLSASCTACGRMWSWRGSPKGQGWNGGDASATSKGAAACAAGKSGILPAELPPRATISGREMFAEVHWSILGKGKGAQKPAETAQRSDSPRKDDSDHFDIEEQLRKARSRCQAKLRVLCDLESGLSRLEEQTRSLRQQMLRTSAEAKAVRVQYDADMTVIEALNDIRRSQCWRRPEPGGGASSSRTATGSSGSSGRHAVGAVDHDDRRTRSPALKGAVPPRAAGDGSPSHGRKGSEKGGGAKQVNGWLNGGF